MRRRAELDAPLARPGYVMRQSALTGKWHEQRDPSQKLPAQAPAVAFGKDSEGEIRLVVIRGTPFDVVRDGVGHVVGVQVRP